jgi:hypothetical protein
VASNAISSGVVAIAHASNSFDGTVTLTTPDDSIGITSPTPGTYALTTIHTTQGAASSTSSAIEVVIDGGGSAITTGIKGDLEVPFACTIGSARLFADQSGSIVVDIWRDVYASFPPTDADSITASAPPTLSGAQSSQDTTLTGWTTTLAEGDVLRFNVDSASTVQRVTLSLGVTR